MPFWEQQPDLIGDQLEKHTKSIYGGPSEATFTSKDQVLDILTQVIEELEGLLKDREEVSDYTKKGTSSSSKNSGL